MQIGSFGPERGSAKDRLYPGGKYHYSYKDVLSKVNTIIVFNPADAMRRLLISFLACLYKLTVLTNPCTLQCLNALIVLVCRRMSLDMSGFLLLSRFFVSFLILTFQCFVSLSFGLCQRHASEESSFHIGESKHCQQNQVMPVFAKKKSLLVAKLL